MQTLRNRIISVREKSRTVQAPLAENKQPDSFKETFERWHSTIFDGDSNRWNRVILVHPSKVPRVRAACGTTRTYVSKGDPALNQSDCVITYKIEKGFGNNSFLLGCGATNRTVYLMLREWLGEGNFFVTVEDQFVQVQVTKP